MLAAVLGALAIAALVGPVDVQRRAEVAALVAVAVGVVCLIGWLARLGVVAHAHARVARLPRDVRNGGEIAFRGDRKTGLDHIDAHLVQHLGDFQLFPMRHGGAG